jgi:hypothetical protein
MDHGAGLMGSNASGLSHADECTVTVVRGASLTVERPAVPFIYTGPLTSPAKQPVGKAPLLHSAMLIVVDSGVSTIWMLYAGAVWDGRETGARGRVAVMGSSSMFDDSWLGKHSNKALLDWLLTWLQQACAADVFMLLLRR